MFCSPCKVFTRAKTKGYNLPWQTPAVALFLNMLIMGRVKKRYLAQNGNHVD